MEVIYAFRLKIDEIKLLIGHYEKSQSSSVHIHSKLPLVDSFPRSRHSHALLSKPDPPKTRCSSSFVPTSRVKPLCSLWSTTVPPRGIETRFLFPDSTVPLQKLH